MDRGYESFWLFNLIISLRAQFCARVSTNKWKIIKRFVRSGNREQIVKLGCTAASAKKCAEMGLDKKPIKLRLIRVDLPSGETEVLVTTLIDPKRYPAEIFGDLYHQRWPVEEDYKIMKCRIQIENFSGKTIHSVYQDFHAKVLSKNLTAIFIRSVDNTVKRINGQRIQVYKVNFTNALATMRHHIVVLFGRGTEQVLRVVQKIQSLVVKALSEIRKNRTVPRKFKASRSKFHQAYKPIS
jgi:hypothetical protein